LFMLSCDFIQVKVNWRALPNCLITNLIHDLNCRTRVCLHPQS